MLGSKHILVTLLALALAVAGCAGCDQPPAAGTAGPQQPGSVEATLACANMAKLKCPEAAGSDCANRLDAIVAGHMTNIGLGCLAAATTPAQVQACGGVACFAAK